MQLTRTISHSDEKTLRKRCHDLCERINKRYPDEKQLSLTPIEGMAFEYKQDFSEAWTQKLPSMLMQEYFRMADTLTYVLMANFTDDDVADKPTMIDTCCSQFAERLKTWYPEYAAADEAQDALGNDDNDIQPVGLYSADLSSINIKRAVEDVKAGRRLSDATRKRIQAAIDKINSHVVELQAFISDDPVDDSTEVPKSVLAPEYIFDITSGLNVLDTLTPASYRPSAPLAQKTHSPVSLFPTLEDVGYEVDITDLLTSIQQSMKSG